MAHLCYIPSFPIVAEAAHGASVLMLNISTASRPAYRSW
ncbi:hypothetical protein ACFDR8_000138 [Arthrobacter sp. MP_2.3]